MLGNSFPAFLFCPTGVTWRSTKELLEKLQSLKAELFLITDRSNAEAARDAGGKKAPSLVIPTAIAEKEGLPVDLFTPIPYIVPAQLFAASLAEVKRLDPDRPRTLSKVTQTI
jgi:glucosamine--fructose-6-phosphate aminotransferase (isomerizing)